ncbi:PREDICTED: G0/G1 switch protein 2 [Dipodomys ordii]|uniref:G0/G1 switch protein 2 n=1 Tax=Dipodomys ordii TaxID=10020 RepID=A0A1S3F2I9_DIPOR|nr:PREDICTED: G0/G1 switch protein 2 [Dipodomys ordii]
METVQELIPLAKEMMAQKPRGKLVKLYVLGSVLALVGAVLGLVETVCSPFAAASRLPRLLDLIVAKVGKMAY